MPADGLPKEFIEKCMAVTAKRAKTVIDHILKHGHITTEELKELYGYNHPPRAARDVREQGIPLDTFNVKASDGRSIGAYRFGDVGKARFSKLSGRTAFAKDLKEKLIEAQGTKCAIYLEEFDERLLQIDHRIPFEVDGDGDDADDPGAYMLLCGSANRAKSWSCEHCKNWMTIKDRNICLSCYWAYPDNYTHVAMKDERRLDLVWTNDDLGDYDRLKDAAIVAEEPVQYMVKRLIREGLSK